jgi:hypothetical protein
MSLQPAPAIKRKELDLNRPSYPATKELSRPQEGTALGNRHDRLSLFKKG